MTAEGLIYLNVEWQVDEINHQKTFLTVAMAAILCECPFPITIKYWVDAPL